MVTVFTESVRATAGQWSNSGLVSSYQRERPGSAGGGAAGGGGGDSVAMVRLKKPPGATSAAGKQTAAALEGGLQQKFAEEWLLSHELGESAAQTTLESKLVPFPWLRSGSN